MLLGLAVATNSTGAQLVGGLTEDTANHGGLAHGVLMAMATLVLAPIDVLIAGLLGRWPVLHMMTSAVMTIFLLAGTGFGIQMSRLYIAVSIPGARDSVQVSRQFGTSCLVRVLISPISDPTLPDSASDPGPPRHRGAVPGRRSGSRPSIHRQVGLQEGTAATGEELPVRQGAQVGGEGGVADHVGEQRTVSLPLRNVGWCCAVADFYWQGTAVCRGGLATHYRICGPGGWCVDSGRSDTMDHLVLHSAFSPGRGGGQGRYRAGATVCVGTAGGSGSRTTVLLRFGFVGDVLFFLSCTAGGTNSLASCRFPYQASRAILKPMSHGTLYISFLQRGHENCIQAL